jgi:predicted phosphate transport protein (TIGR00153 family)
VRTGQSRFSVRNRVRREKFMLWNKEKSIIDKIKAYLDQVDVCRSRFRVCIENLLFHPEDAENRAILEEVHCSESKADDLRRTIELQLYQRALIPESRGDVLGLLETLDLIPGMFQSLCFQFLLEKIVFPEQFRERYLHLVDVNIKAYDLVRQAVLGLFFKQDVKDLTDLVDAVESDSDHNERELIRDIFNSKLDKADKILLKEIVINTGDISDQAETVKDRLILAIVKRKI